MSISVSLSVATKQEANLCRTLSDLAAVGLLLPPAHILLVAASIALVTRWEGKIHVAAHLFFLKI